MALQELIVWVARYRNGLLVVAVLGLCSCASVGPRSISAGRGAYAEVINRTEDEQILNVVVRERYDETFGMITVAAVTANLRFRAETGANVGIGDSDNYETNLVPFSAGVGYEENPTISYVPLSGEDFTRRMLSPVAVDEWLLLGAQAKRPGHMLDLAVRRINGLRNSLASGNPPSPGFSRLIEVYDQLRRANVITIARDNDGTTANDFYWSLHDYSDSHQESVQELFDLLGIETEVDGADIFLPVREGLGRSTSEIVIGTRSAFDVLNAFGNGVDIPAPHLQAGIVEPLQAALVQERQYVRIRSSAERPDNATVRIRFRDWWFYIDATDAESKRAFIFLRTLIGIRLADPGADQKSPVITVPVR